MTEKVKKIELEYNEKRLLNWVIQNANGIETTFKEVSLTLDVTEKWAKSYARHLKDKGFDVTLNEETFIMNIKDYEVPLDSENYLRFLKILTNRVKHFGTYIINREWLIEDMANNGCIIEESDINRAIYDKSRFDEPLIRKDGREEIRLRAGWKKKR